MPIFGLRELARRREDGVSERGIYQGYGLQGVDGKGRVAIPAALRTILMANAPSPEGKDGGSVIISTHESSRCLVGYDSGFSRELLDSAKGRQALALSTGGALDFNLGRKVMGVAEATPFDGSGRFILPEFPRFHAEIDLYALFFGVGDYFEIWNPKTLVDAENAPEVMKAAARFFMKQKGIDL
jgi:MraZ protein